MSSVGIIGSGMAGLVTAKTLLDDGFKVQILTRESAPGGVWSKDRVYPGLKLNNVSGEYRFSHLPMPKPQDAQKTGGRLTGELMQSYMESYEQRFLPGVVRYHVDVLNIERRHDGKWSVKIKPQTTGLEESLQFDKIVLCTGGCSQPNIPTGLSQESADKCGFGGMVVHTRDFKANAASLLSEVKPDSENPIVVVGGGKSAQDAVTYLVNQGRKVIMIFDKADAFLAVKSALPDFIRKSRFLSVMVPHYNLRTRLERFLHKTRLGSLIVHGFWKALGQSSFSAFNLPPTSSLRNTHSLFWGIRTNDEGTGSPSGFFALANAKKFEIVSPMRVESFSSDGEGVVLSDGRHVEAAAVVLATGYSSSWDPLFNNEMRAELGLDFTVPTTVASDGQRWDDYVSLRNPPVDNFDKDKERPVGASSMYKGIVPARNIFNRDFAVNGSSFTSNMGYMCEVQAHWISSYFLEDNFLRLPASINDALAAALEKSAWLRKRYPGTSAWVNESYSADIAFWDTYQACDDLLEDMGLPVMRSGGNWFTWPFKVVDLKEIETLHTERAGKRGCLDQASR